MKRLIFLSMLLFSLAAEAQIYEYKIITTVESIVPAGIGRSRIVEFTAPMDHSIATSERTKENHFKNNKTSRKKLKVPAFKETKLLNFYSMVGINFQNIASNDALVTSKLNEMSQNGWELFNIASGVESDAGKQDGNGIFITRYLFRRPVK